MTLVQGVWLFAVCFSAATLALVASSAVLTALSRSRRGPFAEAGGGTVFLFDGDVLLDATAGARALLGTARAPGTPWQRFLSYAAPRFPGFEAQIERLPELGRLTLTSAGADGSMLVAEWRSGVRRISLTEPHLEPQARMVDALAQKAQDDELELLRQITDDAPVPIWQEGADGSILWANRTYVAMVMRLALPDQPVGWPLRRLFDPDVTGRTALHLPDASRPLWFDCQAVAQPAGRIVFALPVDTAVQAEQALNTFVQTLTKTFAHLPIGLAIFDRQRKLQLFNPALTDLTTLPVEFLSMRPGLFAFFDAMRERGMIPEPKDYKAWRSQMAAMEQSAADGQYEETWALPSGLTYRVMGRPHPEGALALLFQDISDEVTRARRMRADLELGQSVIDATDEAIAVFSSAGHLVMSNSAYARLWSHDPMETLTDHPISRLADDWRAACAPSHFWALAEGYVATAGPREPWISQARLNDGRGLRCRLAPLAGGATLIGFTAEPLADPGPEPGLRLLQAAGAEGASALPVAMPPRRLLGGGGGGGAGA